MPLAHIQYEKIRSWGRITLNRPERRNALSVQMLDELHDALWEADEDREIAAVLIRGAGPMFCSGYELGGPRRATTRLREGASKFRGMSSIADDIWQLDRSRRAMMAIFDMHKPVVAQVHGRCLAGGLDLVLLCDLVIAADDAELGFPPVRSMGTPPMNMWLHHIPVQWAKRLLLTGDSISGADAAEIGLVYEAVGSGELDAACEALMDRMSNIDPDVLAVNKRSLNLAMELMGARTMQRLAGELDARGHLSRGARSYIEELSQKGVKTANEARDRPFGDRMIKRKKR
jgi:enoyl-CoA hydratase